MTLFLSVNDMKNAGLNRQRINELLAVYAPGYGSSLPSASASPDGRIFYVGSQGYQNRSNVWVAL